MGGGVERLREGLHTHALMQVMRALFRPTPPVVARLAHLWSANGLTLRPSRLGIGDADGNADGDADGDADDDARVIGIQVRWG